MNDLLDGHVAGHIDGFGNGAGDEGLHRPHHLDMPHIIDRPAPASRLEGAVEDR